MNVPTLTDALRDIKAWHLECSSHAHAFGDYEASFRHQHMAVAAEDAMTEILELGRALAFVEARNRLLDLDE